jgi:hypothetical protein
MPSPRRQHDRSDCHLGAVIGDPGLKLNGTTSVWYVLHLIVSKKGRLARDLLGLHRA